MQLLPKIRTQHCQMRQKQQDNQNKPQKYREPNKSFHQYKKKHQNLPNKNIQSNNSQENLFQLTQNTLENIHLKIRNIEDDRQIKATNEISHKTDTVDQTVEIVNIEITIQDQIQTDRKFCIMPVLIHVLEIDIIQLIDLETLYKKEIETIPTIGIEIIQTIEIIDVKIVDHAILLTTNQTILDQNILTIKIDHAIIHRTEIQIITMNKETTLNHNIGLHTLSKFTLKL